MLNGHVTPRPRCHYSRDPNSHLHNICQCLSSTTTTVAATMYASSPSSQYDYPSTPVALRHPLQFRPLNSSPLADSPGKSSPVVAAQARRRSQYKSHSPTTPLQSRSVSGGSHTSARLFSGVGNVANFGSADTDPQKVSLRDRFKARCLERAVRARAKAIRGKRYGDLQDPSSDDFQMDDDDSEDDEDIMQDEVCLTTPSISHSTKFFLLSFSEGLWLMLVEKSNTRTGYPMLMKSVPPLTQTSTISTPGSKS